MNPLDAVLQRILSGPSGPEIGAFFDFDGTLIDGYSAAAYFIDRIRRREIGGRELIETVKLARRKDISDAEFGELIAKGVLEWAGQTEDEIRALWQRLWAKKVGLTLFPEAWKLIQAHRKMGHTIAVASSATPYQIEPLAEEYGIEHILATRPLVRNGRLTGGIKGTPMWGEGKAAGVRTFSKKQGIDLARSYGYANGDEDIAFLKSVGKATAVQPKERLEMTAQELNWPILRFAPRKRAPPKAIVRTIGAYAAMFGTFAAGIGYAKATGKTRRAVDFMASVSADAFLAITGIDVEVHHEERLWAHRPCVFIINHQSKIDMFLMMYLVRKNFTGVAKKEAANVPGFGTFMKMRSMRSSRRWNACSAACPCASPRKAPAHIRPKSANSRRARFTWPGRPVFRSCRW
jgi:putative phosphoserine phosphatase/1-acylglycerol-3-phosphate O-acyltransferase